MPLNKQAIIRYKILDRCFSNFGRRYYIEDLIEECNKALREYFSDSKEISKRQIYEDIKFMESEQGWSIPLGRYRDGKRIYYRYKDKSFSIEKKLLSTEEAEQIRAALQILSRFSGTPQFEWVNEIIQKIENNFKLNNNKKVIINFDMNIDLVGLQFLIPLFNAILNERVLLIDYQDFKHSKPFRLEFHPYYIKQYNNRWFVFGLNKEKNIQTWNLALDRIRGIKEINAKYVKSDVDWDEYFYDIVGVTKPDGVSIQEIVLRFNKIAANYVITKPLHPTQIHKFVDNELEVKIKIIPNYELEQLILSFGEQVKVISPESLKHKIHGRLLTAILNYESQIP